MTEFDLSNNQNEIFKAENSDEENFDVERSNIERRAEYFKAEALGVENSDVENFSLSTNTESLNSSPEQFCEKKKKTSGSSKILGYLLFVLCFLLGLLLLPSLAEQLSYSMKKGEERAKVEAAKELLTSLPEAASRIPWVVRSVGAGVVGIRTESVSSSRQLMAGEGTGIVVDEDGCILTNWHVVAPEGRLAPQISIQMIDGRSQSEGIRLLGSDPEKDLALLKIEMSDLHPIPWGDSKELEVGQEVLAIGNPYGLSHSVTKGIISALGRYTQLPNSRELVWQEFLQTDTPINPGNSGGPLVDMQGQLVGVNTMIIGDRYQGISFAIPSNVAKDFYENLNSSEHQISEQ